MTRRFLTFSVAYDYGGRACLRGSFGWRTDDIVFTKKVRSRGWAFQTQAVQKNYGTENLSEPRRSLRYRTPIGEIL